MEDRLERLEATVARLAGAVERLDRRLAVLEKTAGRDAAEPEPASGSAPASSLTFDATVAGWLSLAGRSCLVLCGAFLVRALTEARALPFGAGVAVGLTYAAVWVVLADRDGAREKALSAAFHGLTAVVIAYPILWEAVTRFHELSPAGAAGGLVLLTALILAAAWRRNLRVIAWGATLAAMATLIALLVSTFAIEILTAAVLLLGVGSVWLGYGRLRWYGLRWPVALVADFLVILMDAMLSRPEGPPEAYRGLHVSTGLALSLALPVLYLTSFAVRTLLRRRDVTAFEVIQTVAALLFGFGGAVRVAEVTGFGAGTLGVTALLLAAACYAVAFAFVEKRLGQGRNFVFYTSLGLVLTLSTSELVTGGRVIAIFWSALGLAAAFFGARHREIALSVHSGVYLWAAGLRSGMVASAVLAFAAPAEGLRAIGPAGLAVAGAALIAYGILGGSRRPAGAGGRLARLPALALAILGVAGTAAAAVPALYGVVSHPSGSNAAALAAIRSAVLAAAALALAATRRWTSFAELGWLVYPVLIAGGLKLMLEDLPNGRPAALFVAFACYGVALILAPRLMRGSVGIAGSESSGAARSSVEGPRPRA